MKGKKGEEGEGRRWKRKESSSREVEIDLTPWEASVGR